MAALTLIITDAGRRALVNAASDGTNAVRIVSCGISATSFAAGVTSAALPGEIKRIGTLSGQAIGANVIHLMVRDESAATYTLRSFALYLGDGTLFAVYSQADPILEKSAQALMLLAVDVTLVDVAATSVTFGDANFLNPPATTERVGVVELATEAEAAALADAMRALTPKGAAAIFTAANILARLMQVDGAGSGLDADLLDGLQSTQFVRGDVSTRIGTDVFLQFPNSNYGAALRVGGNAYTAAGADASVVTTNGNLHLDSARGSQLFLNYYSGTGGIVFGTGAGGAAASMSKDGSFAAPSFDGTIMRRGGTNLFGADNDGAGSGLDADLLDGQQGSWYADVASRLGYRPVQQGGGIGQLANLVDRMGGQ